MTALFDADALGLRVQITVPEDLTDAQRAELCDAWAGAVAEPGESDLTVAFRSAEQFEQSMERLTVDVTLAALAAVGSQALMFHAGGVADERGRVAAFVGPSGQGKTTLSRCLGEHYGYVSDETIAVRRDLTILPYRKPLSIVRDGQPKQQISPTDAGLRDLPATPLRLAALTVLERSAEHPAVQIDRLSLVEALPLLVTQMSYLREQQHPLRAVAELCDAVGGVLRLRYSESADVMQHLDEIYDHEHHSSGWQPVDVSPHDGPLLTDQVSDAIAVGDDLIVMAHNTVHVLDGIAPVVWLAASEGRGLDEITSAAVAEFGTPSGGDARELVESAVDALVEAGVLVRR